MVIPLPSQTFETNSYQLYITNSVYAHPEGMHRNYKQIVYVNTPWNAQERNAEYLILRITKYKINIKQNNIILNRRRSSEDEPITV